MTKCKFCGTDYFLLMNSNMKLFCDQKCLDEFVKERNEQYLHDNWREWARMMGAKIIE